MSGLVLIGGVAWLVAAPLFRPWLDMVEPVELDKQIGRWERQKKDAYSAIKEAEFDRQTGKLTEEDYEFLRERYEARALEALTKLNQKETGQGEMQTTATEQRSFPPSEP